MAKKQNSPLVSPLAGLDLNAMVNQEPGENPSDITEVARHIAQKSDMDSKPSKPIKGKKVQTAKPTKGASSGCREGYTRHTYVLPLDLIDKVKAAANYFGISEVAAAERLLSKAIADLEEKHGKACTKLNKGGEMF
jgi:hypothetical protein